MLRRGLAVLFTARDQRVHDLQRRRGRFAAESVAPLFDLSESRPAPPRPLPPRLAGRPPRHARRSAGRSWSGRRRGRGVLAKLSRRASTPRPSSERGRQPARRVSSAAPGGGARRPAGLPGGPWFCPESSGRTGGDHSRLHPSGAGRKWYGQSGGGAAALSATHGRRRLPPPASGCDLVRGAPSPTPEGREEVGRLVTAGFAAGSRRYRRAARRLEADPEHRCSPRATSAAYPRGDRRAPRPAPRPLRQLHHATSFQLLAARPDASNCRAAGRPLERRPRASTMEARPRVPAQRGRQPAREGWMHNRRGSSSAPSSRRTSTSTGGLVPPIRGAVVDGGRGPELRQLQWVGDRGGQATWLNPVLQARRFDPTGEYDGGTSKSLRT